MFKAHRLVYHSTLGWRVIKKVRVLAGHRSARLVPNDQLRRKLPQVGPRPRLRSRGSPHRVPRATFDWNPTHSPATSIPKPEPCTANPQNPNAKRQTPDANKSRKKCHTPAPYLYWPGIEVPSSSPMTSFAESSPKSAPRRARIQGS